MSFFGLMVCECGEFFYFKWDFLNFLNFAKRPSNLTTVDESVPEVSGCDRAAIC